MDVSSAAWLSEMEMEGSGHQMTNPFIEGSFADYPYFLPSFEAGTSYTEQPKCMRVSSSNTFIMSFGNPNSPPRDQLLDIVKPRAREDRDFAAGTCRNLNQAQDHVLAERKRREVLTRRFISLSALLPNLKRMDKATVLEDATKYIKQLQSRMKQLEETTSAKFKQEPNLPVPGGDHIDDDDDETNYLPGHHDTFNPEIEVRLSQGSVLVRIQTHINSSVVRKTLSEMEKHHLSISSSSVIPFSTKGLLITVTAQMSKEAMPTAMEVVKSLQSAITSFI